MPYSIEIFFDPATVAAIRLLWSQLAEISGSSYMVDNGVYPHVALAVFECDRVPASLNTRMQELAVKLNPTALRPTNIGLFDGPEPVIFLAFKACAFLIQAHEHVQTVLDGLGLTNHEHYRADSWIPHCTLAVNSPSSRLSAVMNAASRRQLMLPFQAAHLALIRYPPTELLFSYRLSG